MSFLVIVRKNKFFFFYLVKILNFLTTVCLYCMCWHFNLTKTTLLPTAYCSHINSPSIAGDILTNVLQKQPVELRAIEVQGYLSGLGGMMAGAMGRQVRKTCRQARDEKTLMRLS